MKIIASARTERQCLSQLSNAKKGCEPKQKYESNFPPHATNSRFADSISLSCFPIALQLSWVLSIEPWFNHESDRDDNVAGRHSHNPLTSLPIGRRYTP
jgi:hypothetical protein